MHTTEELLEIFLSKYDRCPIPGIGTLEIVKTSASASLADRTIYPPQCSVKLHAAAASDSKDFIGFISKRKGLGRDEAEQALTTFTQELKHLRFPEERPLPNVGSFYVNSNGELDFRPAAFFEPGKAVPGEWVIHPAASHTMKVGDIETNSVAMAAKLRERDIRKRSFWWIAALLVLLISAGLIAYYYTNPHPAGIGANISPVKTKPVSSTYTTSP